MFHWAHRAKPNIRNVNNLYVNWQREGLSETVFLHLATMNHQVRQVCKSELVERGSECNLLPVRAPVHNEPVAQPLAGLNWQREDGPD